MKHQNPVSSSHRTPKYHRILWNLAIFFIESEIYETFHKILWTYSTVFFTKQLLFWMIDGKIYEKRWIVPVFQIINHKHRILWSMVYATTNCGLTVFAEIVKCTSVTLLNSNLQTTKASCLWHVETQCCAGTHWAISRPDQTQRGAA